MNCMSLKKYIAKAMILALLKEKDTDGYEIALETARYTNFPKGKIYPLLLRFRKNRLISAYFRKSESGFFRKYYKITPPGRLKHLSNMTDTQHLYHMIRKILITGGMKMTKTVKEIVAEIKTKMDQAGGLKHVYFVACGGSKAAIYPGLYLLQSEAKTFGATTYTSNEFVHATPKELD